MPIWSMVALCLAVTPIAQNPDFIEGQRTFDAREYEKAVYRFQKSTRADVTRSERADAFAWLGVSYTFLDDEELAVEAFVAAIDADPLVGVPLASPKVGRLFDRARTQVRQPRAEGPPEPTPPLAIPQAPTGPPPATPAPLGEVADAQPTTAVPAALVPQAAPKTGAQPRIKPPPTTSPWLIPGGLSAGLGVVGLGVGGILTYVSIRSDDAIRAENVRRLNGELPRQVPPSYWPATITVFAASGVATAIGGASG